MSLDLWLFAGRVRVGPLRSGPVAKQMRFDDWQTHWGGQSRLQTFRKNHEYWRNLPEAERPFHSHLPGDYELDRSLTNPAVGGGSDGMDAGCQLRQLPPLVAPSPDEVKPKLPRADDKSALPE